MGISKFQEIAKKANAVYKVNQMVLVNTEILHWNYTEGQKEELQKAVAAKIPKSVIMTYFYPDISAQDMHLIFE